MVGVFWTVFVIEQGFQNAGIPIANMYNIIFWFAMQFLVIMFIWKMITTWFLWFGGDNTENPLHVFVGFLKAIIATIGFGFAYTYFIRIMFQLYRQLVAAFAPNSEIYANLIGESGVAFSHLALPFLNLLGIIVALIVAVQLVLLYFQLLKRGLQIFIIRMTIPFAAIGLLNSNGGAFTGYIKLIMKNAFTVVIQLILAELAISLLFNMNLVLSLITMSLALQTLSMLQEFMVSAGQGMGRGTQTMMMGGKMALSTITKIRAGR